MALGFYGMPKIKNVQGEDMILFYQPTDVFSNFYPASFTLNGQIFNCSEQYFQFRKAATFHDDVMAKRILASEFPTCQRNMGRTVTPFCEEVWNAKSYDIMVEGLFAKFEQNSGV